MQSQVIERTILYFSRFLTYRELTAVLSPKIVGRHRFLGADRQGLPEFYDPACLPTFYKDSILQPTKIPAPNCQEQTLRSQSLNYIFSKLTCNQNSF